MAAFLALSCTTAPPAPETRDGSPLTEQDRPPYASPAELCGYLNDARDAGREHARFGGIPWRGSYHDTWTWPVRFREDAALDAEAQAEADRLARGEATRGKMHRDSSWRRPIWVDGVDTGRQQIAAADRPGDWNPASDVELRAALVQTNGALRLALLHHDPGGQGPVLTRIGCAQATAPDRQVRWWVVLLGP